MDSFSEYVRCWEGLSPWYDHMSGILFSVSGSEWEQGSLLTMDSMVVNLAGGTCGMEVEHHKTL